MQFSLCFGLDWFGEESDAEFTVRSLSPLVARGEQVLSPARLGDGCITHTIHIRQYQRRGLGTGASRNGEGGDQEQIEEQGRMAARLVLFC